MEAHEDNIKDIENGILLTIEDTAGMLGVPVNRIRGWASSGKLPSLSANPHDELQFRMGDVIEFLMERIKAAPEVEWPELQGGNKKKKNEPGPESSESVMDLSVNVGMVTVRAELVPLEYEYTGLCRHPQSDSPVRPEDFRYLFLR